MPLIYRDYPTPFAVQDVYGIMDSTAPPKPKPKPKHATPSKPKASSSSTFSLSRVLRRKPRSPLSSSLDADLSSRRSSIDSQETLTVSTIATSSKSTPAPTPKNYEQAFGALSSSYGFGGGVVAVPIQATRTSSPPTHSAQRTSTSSSFTCRTSNDDPLDKRIESSGKLHSGRGSR